MVHDVVLPKGHAADLERGWYVGLIPEHAILHLVGDGPGLVDDETLIMLRASVENLLEHFECGKQTSELGVQSLLIRQQRFPEDEDDVRVGSDVRGDQQRVLDTEQGEQPKVPPVHEHLAYRVLSAHLRVVNHILEYEERRIYLARLFFLPFLPLNKILHVLPPVLVKYEGGRYALAPEGISGLRGAHADPTFDVSLVV